ncbi:MAG: SusC/RagA family TonB-linked outer membrane protein [Rufibacter sp.]
MKVKLQLKTRCPIKLVLSGLLLNSIFLVGPAAYAAEKGTSQSLLVQNREVTGRVVSNEDGQPLPGVSVVVKGTTNGTSTDTNGNYTLAVNEGAVLVFSFIGYNVQEVTVGKKSKVDIRLVSDQEFLDEVVVVGYGEQKRSDLTGAISSISSEQLNRIPTNRRVDQTLQGLAPGVNVTQTDAQPGGNVKVEIRGGNSIQGNNAPIFVIDGFVAPGNIEGINPNDIESIEVLKDASATAIYGSRGANGVILVTTKKGKAGKPQVNFSASYGLQQVRHKLDLLNASQFATLVNEQRVNDGQAPYFADPASLGEGTDWQDEIFQTAPIQDYNLSFSGGNNQSKFFISGNYFNQEGIIINSNFERGALRANFSSDVSDKFKIGTNLTATYIKRNGLPVNTDPQPGTINIVSAALRTPPTAPVYDQEGNYYQDLEFTPNLVNPVALAMEPTRENLSNRFLGTFFAEYELLEGLSARLNVGGSVINTKNNFYDPKTTRTGAQFGGQARINSALETNWLTDFLLTYSRTINNHSFSVMGGVSQQSFASQSLEASSQGFVTDELLYNNLELGSEFLRPTSGQGSEALKSYMTRVTYNYKDKYLFTGTGRADGSSKFGADHKWAYFPSGSVKWRVSEEAFMKDIALLNDLSLRASYGITGSQALPSYQSLATLNNNLNGIFGDIVYVGVGPGRMANSDLRWESTAQLDIGFDVSILNNRLSATVDYYDKKTTDLLFSKAIPTQSGYGSTLVNIGSIGNKGWEFSVTSRNFTGDFKWTTNANLYFNRSRVIKLGDTEEQFYGGSNYLAEGQMYVLRVGEPVGSFHGYVDNGVFQNQAEIDASAQKGAKPGDIRYVDVNQDGQITPLDRQIIGNPEPKFNYGLNNDFSYKGFDLNIFIHGVQGSKLLHLNNVDLWDVSGQQNNSTAVLDRWTPENPSNTMSRATKTRNTRISNRYVEDASFLRVKNILLGYTIPGKHLQKLKMSSARVYVSAQNLITLTDYSGYDPEVNSRGEDNIQIATDFGAYPTAKTFTVGVNFGF